MNSFLISNKIKFLLVRAGSTDVDVQGRILGSLDLPLNDSGQLEVQLTARDLAELQIDAIYASACQSAQETAKLISRQGKIKVRVEENLTNLNCGLWHGKSLAELREKQPTLFKQWKDHPDSVCPPQGETIDAVHERAETLLRKIHRKFKAGLIAIVAPDPLLSVIRCEIESKPLSTESKRSTKCGGWAMVEPQLEAV